MGMHNPPHPGEFIFATYIEPFGTSIRALADSLGVSPSTINRIINAQSAITPSMALRLSKALGRTPESWLAMQYQFDLWHAKQEVDLKSVKRMKFKAA
jgi:addiction module HigA family antidote